MISIPPRHYSAAVLFTTLALPALAQHAESTLPAVTVSETALQGSNSISSVAGFSETAVSESPASVSVITATQMQERGVRQTTDLARVDASLSDAYNAIGYAEQFSIRGFTLDNAASYRKDGLVISSDASIPLENKERIEVLKGVAGLQAGVATPGGILNYVTKRPSRETLRSVTMGASERGTLYSAVDLGGRWQDERFGYRINAAAEKLRSYVKGANGERTFVSGAFDFRLTPQSLLQLDFDHQHKSQVTAPGFQLLGGIDLPTGISARTMLNDQEWTRPTHTDSTNVGLRYEVQLNANWNGSLAVNRHRFRRDDFAAFPYGCAAEGLFPGFCANGDFDVYDFQSDNEEKTLLATRALLQGRFNTGTIQHALSVGADTMRRRDYFGDCVYGTMDCIGSAANGTSNIYAPVAVNPSTIRTGPVRLRRRGDERSLFVQDVIGLTEAWKLHAGLRYTEVEREQYDAAATLAARHDKGYLLPNVALAFHPRQDWTLYGAYSQGLEHGGIAPLFTTNQDQMLDPSKSRQIEFGAKAELAGSWTVSGALFRITKPLEYTDADFTYVRAGEARHDGIEVAVQGLLTRELKLGVSLAALRARQLDTGLPSLDGKRVTNVPELKSVVYLNYSVPQVSGLAIDGSWVYAGSKAFSLDNSKSVPGYHLLNLGARYATRLGGTATTLRFQVDNVFDKFYWRDVTQSLGGYLFPGAPRTFRLTAQFDF